MTGSTRVAVTGSSPYDVVVGHDLAGELAALLGPDVRRVAVICSPDLAVRASSVTAELTAGGYLPSVVGVPAGEAAKSAAVIARCWGELGRLGFTRSDAVVSVGGGGTTDVAGFVAATFLRGIAVVHVPTTLLAMVDAAVGGKTGINTPEGKNLVGSFHEPAGVVCDLSTLDTLPRAELASGLAEVVKCGFIADPGILDLVERDAAGALEPGSATLRELVERAIAVKARVVSTDLREATSTGSAIGREALNYGHTLAHAIERLEHYAFRHGDAVAIGMVFVAELARNAGLLDAEVVDRHRRLLEMVELPTTYAGERWDALHDAMRLDKKTRGDRLRFVVLEDVARPMILAAPADALLVAAYASISA